uniref:Uncharacterized protein n=1 Tax=Anguilla anguilla TaxID=7936 RepID=A0A0E9WV68_ANGAN
MELCTLLLKPWAGAVGLHGPVSIYGPRSLSWPSWYGKALPAYCSGSSCMMEPFERQGTPTKQFYHLWNSNQDQAPCTCVFCSIICVYTKYKSFQRCH